MRVFPTAAVLALVCAMPVAAQDEARRDGPRPKIGLVLSGGGARGAAHAGILSVLEELRVPVDCIAGTSMGAIVGGLYAYGMSPTQLRAILTRDGAKRGWSYLLADGPLRRDLSFRRKEDDRTFLADVEIGVSSDGMGLPKGFIQGQNLETELRFLTLEAHGLESFDQLPIPFRCVATAIDNGEEVVLGSGNLADALRASMSLPGVFAPITIDGRELLDGGLVNNVPIEVARAMGADVVIAVDIGTPLADPDDIVDVFGVTGQMVAILTQQNVDRSLAQLSDGDLLIRPDLGELTAADFDRAAEAIAIGEAAARAAADRLSQFAVSKTEYAAWQEEQRRTPAPPPRIRAVHVDNNSGLGDALVRHRLDLTEGEVLDQERFWTGIEQVYGLDDFERVVFQIRDWRDGAADLYLTAEEKGWGPSYLRFGLNLETDFEGESSVNFRLQFTARAINSLGAEWRNELQVGDQNRLLTEFYQPLDASGRFFVAPRFSGMLEPVNVFDRGQKIAEADVLSGAAGVDVGMSLGNWGELRAGLERSKGSVDFGLTSVPLSDFEFDDFVVRSQLRVDTLDDAAFPGSGIAGGVEWRAAIPDLGAEVSYGRIEGRLLGAIALGAAGATAIVPYARIEAAVNDTLPVYAQPTIGGFLNLSGLPANAIRAQHVGLAAVLVRHRISGRAGAFGMPVYVGGSAEVGDAWNTRSEIFVDLRIAGSGFLGMDTPAGPLYLGAGFAEGGEHSLYFFLGPTF